MLNNKKYFQNEFKILDSKFRPRPEAISYYRKIQNEKSLLDFVKESFSKFDKKEVLTGWLSQIWTNSLCKISLSRFDLATHLQ